MRILILTLALLAAAGVATAIELPPLPPVGGGSGPAVTCEGQVGTFIAFDGGVPVVQVELPDCTIDPGL